jgi:hypothetical protein
VLGVDQLRATERAGGFRYPAALWAVADDLMPQLVAALPGGRAATPVDVAEARALGLDGSLVPFACEPQPAHTDYYCCRLEDGPAVAIFADHAVVADWPTYHSFLEWVRHQVA